MTACETCNGERGFEAGRWHDGTLGTWMDCPDCTPNDEEEEARAMVVHCKRESYDVYIGRGRGGRWGNPFSHKDVAGTERMPTRDMAIRAYRRWLWTQIKDGEVSLHELAELNGKTLGCWCAPQACHGEVLAAAAAWAVKKLDMQHGIDHIAEAKMTLDAGGW